MSGRCVTRAVQVPSLGSPRASSHRRRARRLVVLAAAALVLVAAGCGGSQGGGAGSTAATPTSPGYLSKRYNGVIYLSWQKDGSNAAGHAFESLEQLGNADPTKLVTQSASFSASIDGSAVHIKVGDPLSADWRGTVGPSSMQVHYVDDDGMTRTLTFAKADAAQYHAAVAAFHCGCQG
jgi:hypothetical protein